MDTRNKHRPLMLPSCRITNIKIPISDIINTTHEYTRLKGIVYSYNSMSGQKTLSILFKMHYNWKQKSAIVIYRLHVTP